ncbi:MAG: RNA polymerase sigma-70 factor [Bacteroidales bacterium]
MISEPEILSSLKEGSQKAFSLLYYKYCQDVYSLSYKYLGSSEQAEDMLQDLFCQIWEMRENIDPARPFNRYLFTILKNKLLNVLRDRKDVFSIDEQPGLESAIPYKPTDEEDELTEEQLLLVRKAIGQLSPQKRKVFELKLSGRYSNQEIADQLSVSVNTIKVQYSQSLKEIKGALHTSVYFWILMHLPFD